MSSLVIQTSFLGDVVLTTPLLGALAERGAVDVVVTPAAAPLLRGHPAVREVIVYDKRGTDRGAAGFLRLARRLRGRAGTAYLAQGSARSAGLAVAAGCGRRVGFDTSAGRALYSTRVRYREDWHHAERLWALAHPDAATPPPAARRPRLVPDAAAVAAAGALLEAAGVPAGTPLLALAPGSVWATKRWPGYPALAAALAPRLADGARLVLLGAPNERAEADAVQGALAAAGAGPAVDAVGRLPLPASAALLARCAALVANDSLPTHLASAVDVPTVTVFGPTVPTFGFGPLASRAAVVEVLALPCRPCDRHGPRRCPLDHWRCMRDVGVGAVLDQLAALAPSLFRTS